MHVYTYKMNIFVGLSCLIFKQRLKKHSYKRFHKTRTWQKIMGNVYGKVERGYNKK